MSEARANSRSPTRIATVLPQREFALTEPRRIPGLVHHVVVIEARHMGQLNDYRCLHHVRSGGARPEVGAEDDKQRPEAFPASCDDVLRGFGHQVRIRFGGLEQRGLDELKLGSDSQRPRTPRLASVQPALFLRFPPRALAERTPCRQRMNSPAC